MSSIFVFRLPSRLGDATTAGAESLEDVPLAQKLMKLLLVLNIYPSHYNAMNFGLFVIRKEIE